jgi:hypothetical protein
MILSTFLSSPFGASPTCDGVKGLYQDSSCCPDASGAPHVDPSLAADLSLGSLPTKEGNNLGVWREAYRGGYGLNDYDILTAIGVPLVPWDEAITLTTVTAATPWAAQDHRRLSNSAVTHGWFEPMMSCLPSQNLAAFPNAQNLMGWGGGQTTHGADVTGMIVLSMDPACVRDYIASTGFASPSGSSYVDVVAQEFYNHKTVGDPASIKGHIKWFVFTTRSWDWAAYGARNATGTLASFPGASQPSYPSGFA